MLEEKLVLKTLLSDVSYFIKVIPFIDESLFTDRINKKIYKIISAYHNKYNKKPEPIVLSLFADRANGLTEEDQQSLVSMIEYIDKPEEINISWLLDETEQWIQYRKYYDSLINAAEQIDKGQLDLSLAENVSSALAFSFDSSVGMEFSDVDARWDAYTLEEDRIPFGIEEFNIITRGGLCRKTLNALLSSDTGGFKTGAMVHLSADYVRQGQNVLYISLEMAEDKILERFDANMLSIEIDNIVGLGKDTFKNSIFDVQKRAKGRFIVKQFPPTTCHSGHIRYLLKELKLKRNFIPDVIVVDYLNLMASSRLKASDSGNSYGYIKAITEELRALMIEFNAVGWTATQSNRGGSENENLDITDISECIYINEVVTTSSGTKSICKTEIGEMIDSYHRNNQIKNVFPISTKDCIKITTKSGKSIIVSKSHKFPSNRGRISYLDGLSIGDFLCSR